jgi:uncharacterized repeat protein (TIGR03843 family)
MREFKFHRMAGHNEGVDPVGDEITIAFLENGTLAVEGLLPWGSNYTFLGFITQGDRVARVVYKPVRGERPLWDFPHGTLAQREVAAFVVCHALGWHFVPPTVLREGPHGLGSVQLFVNVDQDAHFFTFRDQPEYRPALEALVLFDVIANNADRKAGHCLKAGSGGICAIDHGVCFNAQPKLRTVIWDFAGQPIAPAHLNALCALQAELSNAFSPVALKLAGLLAREEVGAVRVRLATLIDQGVFPEPPENRRPFPWPLV